MASVVTLLFVCFGLAAADVAHLARSYLPPSRLVALPQAAYSGSRTSSFTAGGGYSDRLIQAAPSRSYIAPASSSFTSTNFVSGYSAPARLTAPVTQVSIQPAIQTYATSEKLIAPAQYQVAAQAPAPAPAPTFTEQRFTSAKLVAPSREYLSPEVETFEPIVQQRYTAPAATYTAPAATYTAPAATYTAPAAAYTAPAFQSTSSAFTSGIDTQYSADGGYVY